MCFSIDCLIGMVQIWWYIPIIFNMNVNSVCIIWITWGMITAGWWWSRSGATWMRWMWWTFFIYYKIWTRANIIYNDLTSCIGTWDNQHNDKNYIGKHSVVGVLGLKFLQFFEKIGEDGSVNPIKTFAVNVEALVYQSLI